MQRLRAEDGFTLPELLVSMAIALIVSLAAFSLIETVMKRSGEVGARVETTATARTAMDQITRQLRSQVCAKRASMGTARSVDAAGPTSLSVFTDFTNENYGGGVMPAPSLRTIAWANNIFTENAVPGTRDTSNNTVSYPVPAKPVGTATPVPVGTTRRLVTNVVATEFYNNDPTKPIFFHYYQFPEPDPGNDELPGNVNAQPDEEIAAGEYRALTEAELGAVARITVEFSVLPRSGNRKGATSLESEIYVRTADPNAQTPKPTCLTY